MEHRTKDGRVWVCAGEEPYTRKDGSETTLLVWHTTCATCGGIAVAKTPTDFSTSCAFGRKNCGTCAA